MKRLKARICLSAVLLLCCVLILSSAMAEFRFSDTRFIGRFTTENLDAIISEYDLFDGWYWTTKANQVQTFHGQPDHPGWTDTAVNTYELTGYEKGWYGCRWGANMVFSSNPATGGFGECFGFAQFIGYLLSGDTNPQHHWKYYYSLEDAGGLKVGDIVRVEYHRGEFFYHHSAVVYAVNGEEILFMQCSGSAFNRISVGTGFSDGNVRDVRSPEQIRHFSYLKISRCELNLDPDSE